MDLPRLVMRRAFGVAVLGVLAWGLLGLARMRDDVDDELAGARSLAVLFERLNTLEAVADDAQARALLSSWPGEGLTRHLQVQVADGRGQLVMRSEPEGQVPVLLQGLVEAGEWLFRPAPPFTVSWSLARPQGPAWTVSVTSAPQSERAEALGLLLAGAALLALLAAGMLAVMAWNTRQALAPMGRLLAAIRAMQHGDEEQVRVPPLPPMPIAELETIAAALRQLDASLASARQQRQQLARQVMALQEDERQRLARELHDEFGQQLTALRVNAAWLQRRLGEASELLPVVKDMTRQCEAIQADVRQVLTRLQPLGAGAAEALSLASLRQMLDHLVAAWPRGAGAQTRLDWQWQLLDQTGRELAPEAAEQVPMSQALVLGLYRISQEALTNVVRHASAAQAGLRLRVQLLPAGQMGIDWSVEDDGQGLDEQARALASGNGLAGIRQRLWALGADLRLGPATAQTHRARPGCRLSAHWQVLDAGDGSAPTSRVEVDA